MEVYQTEQLEDKALLIRLSEGDEIAFVKIYNQYRHKIYTYAWQLSKSADTADEIVQEVFIRIWQKRAQINTELSSVSKIGRAHV